MTTHNQLTVLANHTVTPNMQRMTLQGEILATFPEHCSGGYIKLQFNQLGGTDISCLAEGERPVLRTYTIRHFDQSKQQIEVDFVRHITQDQQCGFASRWAMQAQEGDTITIRGPGSIQEMNDSADWYFMVADMTALPALSAKIARLPKNAQGYAVIQIESAEDKQLLQAPEGMTIYWVTSDLVDRVQSLEWKAGQAAVWCACEFDSMRALRQYFRNEKAVERDMIYISSYWKKGVSEDGHKVIKHQDAEEQERLTR
ncbi:siderophore-interacting protein [Vibrio sp. TRT 17S01]|uniref:siderophore-interacting protein n=1 Tax=Vibrio sp. TRT 17S01 TaxID=3418505 RepID=UPI003CEA7BBD